MGNGGGRHALQAQCSFCTVCYEEYDDPDDPLMDISRQRGPPFQYVHYECLDKLYLICEQFEPLDGPSHAWTPRQPKPGKAWAFFKAESLREAKAEAVRRWGAMAEACCVTAELLLNLHSQRKLPCLPDALLREVSGPDRR